MKQATVKRDPSTDEGTTGVLTTADGELTFITLELPDRANAPDLSCIPAGQYVLRWQQSPKHGWCYHFLNVPDRSYVELHPANFAGDVAKGYVSELLGCMALGYAVGKLQPDQQKHPGAPLQRALVRDGEGRGSRSAVDAFDAWGAEEDVELTIT